MSPKDKDLVILSGDIKTPPLGSEARIEAGFLLRKLQNGINLSLPESRPMPTIGKQCHELRINDSKTNKTWRIIYRVDKHEIVIAEVFAKKTGATPKHIIDTCKKRYKLFDGI